MSCPKEDHEELSTFAGSLSPKSLFSLVSLDSDEEPRVQSVETFEEGELVYTRVMKWFAERNIERGDPGAILDEYLQQKRQMVAASLKIVNSTSEQNLEKKAGPKLRRPLTLKVSTQLVH